MAGGEGNNDDVARGNNDDVTGAGLKNRTGKAKQGNSEEERHSVTTTKKVLDMTRRHMEEERT
jgi:hypothetical protein